MIALRTKHTVRVPKLKSELREKVVTSLGFHLKNQSGILMRNGFLKWVAYTAKPSEAMITVDKHNVSKVFTMIAIFQRIFQTKSKRCFNPPYVVKDAD